VFCLFILARRYRSHVHIFVMHLMAAMVSSSNASMVILIDKHHLMFNCSSLFPVLFIDLFYLFIYKLLEMYISRYCVVL